MTQGAKNTPLAHLAGLLKRTNSLTVDGAIGLILYRQWGFRPENIAQHQLILFDCSSISARESGLRMSLKSRCTSLTDNQLFYLKPSARRYKQWTVALRQYVFCIILSVRVYRDKREPVRWTYFERRRKSASLLVHSVALKDKKRESVSPIAALSAHVWNQK